MTAHDPALVAKVAEAIDRHHSPHQTTGEAHTDEACLARDVLDALDLPGIERRARAEALREAASGWWDRWDVVDRFEPWRWLNARAAEVDPEEADDDA